MKADPLIIQLEQGKILRHIPVGGPVSVGRRTFCRAMIARAVALTLCACAFSAWAADPLPTVDQIYLAEQAGRTDEAQRMIAQVLAAQPKSAKAHFVQAELYARASKISLARTELAIAEQLQPSLQFAKPRAISELRARLSQRRPSNQGLAQGSAQGSAESTPPEEQGSHPQEYRVLLASKAGILVAPAVLNNAIKLNFFVDSGATDVSIPADLFSSMVRSGAISEADITGSRKFIDANGDSSKSTTFILRSLKVGNVEVSGVEASVSPLKGPLLLGQSFLKRFKSWSIDNATQELILRR